MRTMSARTHFQYRYLSEHGLPTESLSSGAPALLQPASCHGFSSKRSRARSQAQSPTRRAQGWAVPLSYKQSAQALKHEI